MNLNAKRQRMAVHQHIDNLRNKIISNLEQVEYYKDLSVLESLKFGLIAAAHQFSHEFLCNLVGIDAAKHINEKK